MIVTESQKRKTSALRAKVQRFKRIKVSRIQGSLLPGPGQTDVAVPIVVPAADDVEPAGMEAAHAHASAIRVEVRTSDVGVLEQPNAFGEEIADDGVDQHTSCWCFLVAVEKRLLFIPRLRCRVVDRSLADQMPSDLALVLGERLLVVPCILVGVEELVLDPATEFADRQREGHNKDVCVLAGQEDFLGERHIGEIRELLLRGVDPEVLDRLFDAEDGDASGPCPGLARRGLEATVFDQSHHLRGEVVALGLDDILCKPEVETGRLECIEQLITLTTGHFWAHDGIHRIPSFR